MKKLFKLFALRSSLIILFMLFIAHCSAQWFIQPSGTTANLHSVCFTDANHGWAVGDSGIILKYDGKKWTRQNSGTKKTLNSVAFIDSLHGWAAGGIILKYNGKNWITFSDSSYYLNSVSFIDTNNGWGLSPKGCVLRFMKNKLLYPDFCYAFSTINSIFATDSNNLWIIGKIESLPLRYFIDHCYAINQNTDIIDEHVFINEKLNSCFFLDVNTGWAVGSSYKYIGYGNYLISASILKYDSGKWSQKDLSLSRDLKSVYFVDKFHGWVIGDSGTILKFNGTQWTIQNSNIYKNLTSVSFTDKFNGWIVGEKGLILHTTNGGDSTKYKIQGTITYDNIYNTPLKRSKLYLKNNEKKIVDSAITDTTGYYVFKKVINGNYSLLVLHSSLPPWGGVDPADALMINRNYIKSYNFTDILLKRAADVNLDSKINPIDALMVNRRYLKIISSFKVSDWLWDNDSITVDGHDVSLNIKGVCAGDANGSYVPK